VDVVFTVEAAAEKAGEVVEEVEGAEAGQARAGAGFWRGEEERVGQYNEWLQVSNPSFTLVKRSPGKSPCSTTTPCDDSRADDEPPPPLAALVILGPSVHVGAAAATAAPIVLII
jgi:hypothetical protein